MHRPTSRQRVSGYLIAVALTAAAVGARLLIGDRTSLVFVTLYPAILGSAWWGGLGPAGLSLAMCALSADYFWMDPRGSLALASEQEVMNLALFVFIGGLTGFPTARLRDVQRRFRSLLEATSEGFAVIDRRWVCLYANPRLPELLGVEPSALVGVRVWEALAGRFPDDLAVALRTAMKGTPVLHVLHAAPLGRTLSTDVYSTREGVALLTRDVTAARDLEERRTALVSELEAANRLKDEFMATLSHELRTPLQAIVSWAQVLGTAESTAPVQVRAAESIQRNADSLKRLVDDLLDNARIDSGKLRIERQPTDLAAVAAEAVEMLRQAADEKQVRLEFAVQARRTLVLGDAGRLKQALANLVSNAVKFTPPDGCVTVGVRREGSAVMVVVEDTGVGIAPELLPHVFDRFVQAHVPLVPGGGGLGLGLAIAKHLVEAHDGLIVASSSGPSRGATFTVSLPVLGTVRAADDVLAGTT